MKIRHLKVSAVLLAATLLTSSCVGSFALFNKLAGWNKQATDNKFLNELIFILISPAYAVCTFADVLVINSIEFWTGSNPMAQRVGETQEITGKDGKLYAVTTLRNGYKVKYRRKKRSLGLPRLLFSFGMLVRLHACLRVNT